MWTYTVKNSDDVLQYTCNLVHQSWRVQLFHSYPTVLGLEQRDILVCESEAAGLSKHDFSNFTRVSMLLTLIKMGFLKNDLENFNCLFLKKV